MTEKDSFVAGGAVARAQPDSVGLNPGWRRGVALLYTAWIWDEGASVEVIEEAQRGVVRDVEALDWVSPDSATYMNEVRILSFFFFADLGLFLTIHCRRLYMNLISKIRSLESIIRG